MKIEEWLRSDDGKNFLRTDTGSEYQMRRKIPNSWGGDEDCKNINIDKRYVENIEREQDLVDRNPEIKLSTSDIPLPPPLPIISKLTTKPLKKRKKSRSISKTDNRDIFKALIDNIADRRKSISELSDEEIIDDDYDDDWE